MRQVNLLPKLNHQESLQRSNDGYLVGGMILLGLLLRLPFLKLGLFRDEGSTYFDAVGSTLDKIIQTVILCELNPPGFFLLMHEWISSFGAQEIVFKLPAFIFGLLLIPATYKLGRVVSSQATGLLAALFVTLTPAAVYYSQEARPYTLTALLACLCVILYCYVLISRYHKQYLFGFVFCAASLVYVHYTGLLLVSSLAAVTALFWLRYQELNLRISPFIFAFGAIFFLFLPWLHIFLMDLSIQVPWEQKSHLWNFPNQLLDHLSYTIPLIRPIQKLLSLPVLLILGGRLFLFLYKTEKISRQQSLIFTLELTLGISTILEAFFLSDGSRYMFPLFPVAWVIYSYWLITLFQYLHSRKTKLPLKLGFVLLLIWILILPNTFSTLYKGYQALYHPKSGVRTLLAEVKKNNWQKTVFLIAPNLLAPSFGYYSAQMQVNDPFYGFPSWNHPELLKLSDYIREIHDPTAVITTEQRIDEQAQRGYRQLALVTLAGPEDSQIKQLLAKLVLTYPLLLTKDYSGDEAVTLELFSLDSQSKGKTCVQMKDCSSNKKFMQTVKERL